jgi:crotonobetainyl-CoA:carnitine CoA-transferase CaiB-like acyl-CoA transferase
MDALEGLTILDLTQHVAGPYATKLLADLGARVIKVERPGGDPSRQLGPWLADEPDATLLRQEEPRRRPSRAVGIERSGTYQYLNTNKESIVLDLKTDDGYEVLSRLIPNADLVVIGYAPAIAERLRLDYPSLCAIADVPVLSITNFGHDGPYRDYTLSDTVLYAMGGEMFSHGLAHREPLKLGGTAALLQCGAMAAVAAMGAINAWELHRIGQHVDLRLFEVQINNLDRRSSTILGYRFSGRVNVRAEGSSAGLAGGIYPVADGFVEVTAAGGAYWPRFVDMIGDDALRDPRFTTPPTMFLPDTKAEVDAIVYPWMLSRTMREVWAEARRAAALVAPVFTAGEVFNDAVYRERGLWTEVEHAVLGRFPMLGRPYTLEKTPWRIRHAAPMLGQHTDAILGELDFDASQIAAMREEGAVA